MINSDVFVMIPVSGNYMENKELLSINNDKDCESFYTKLDEQIKYACRDSINDILTRNHLGVYKFLYYKNDEYEKGESIAVDCFLSLCYQKETQLGILEIIFKNFKYEDSQLGAIFHTGRTALIYNSNKLIDLKDFIKSLNLAISGPCRVLYQNDKNFDDSSLKYLLSGETKERVHNEFDIDDNFVRNNFKDLLEYNAYVLYASDKAIIQLMDNFKSDFKDNIEDEIMPFYLIEFSILQNSAVFRMNKVITDKLNDRGRIKLKESLKLIEDFGKTIKLWDKNIYKYYFDQKIADQLTTAFKTPELRDEYSINKSHLEQLTNIKKAIDDNKANCILGAITFLFTIINLYEIIINYHDYIQHPTLLTISFSFLYIAWVIYLLYRHHNY